MRLCTLIAVVFFCLAVSHAIRARMDDIERYGREHPSSKRVYETVVLIANATQCRILASYNRSCT